MRAVRLGGVRLGDSAPKDLDVIVVAVADVARNIEIVAGDVRCSVEEIEQIAPTDDRANDSGRLMRDGAQRGGAGVGERRD
jgi:hypothetical protein